MNQATISDQPKRRPGGRTANVTRRVHRAIIDLIVEKGVSGCTFSAVAERAGIERSTLYRRFPDRWGAIFDALMARAGNDATPDLREGFAENLTAVLMNFRDTIETPLGPALVSVALALRGHEASGFPRAYFNRRMSQLQPMLDAAIARSELSADADLEEIFTFAAGPIFFRTFIAARRADDAFIASVVSKVCSLYCAPGAAAKLSLPPRMS